MLRNRQYTILFSGQVVSTLGTNLFLLALPWYVYVSTNSKADLAIVGFAGSLPALAGIFAGVFVDRWNKRLTMIAADAIRAVLAAAVGLIALLPHTFPAIIALVLLLQLAGVLFGPAEMALIPMVVGEEEVPGAMGLNQSGGAIAQLAGQAGGGALLMALGAPLLFLANAASFLVSVVSLLFIRTAEPSHTSQPHAFFKEWRAGFALFGRSRMILLIVSAALVTNFGLAAFDIALTAWVRGPLHGNALWLGLVGAGFFLGVIAGGVSLGAITRKLPLRATLIAGLITTGVVIGAVGLIANPYWTIAVLTVCGFSVGILNGSVGAMAIRVIPESMRGRVFGLLGALSMAAAPAGIAVFGALMVYIPLQALFATMGSLCVASGLAFFLPVKDDLARLQTIAAEDATGARGMPE